MTRHTGAGTQEVMPGSFPFSSGLTLPTALAARVGSEMTFWATPLPLCHSFPGEPSTALSHLMLANLAPGRWRWAVYWWQVSHCQLWLWHWTCLWWNHTGICRSCSWGQWRGSSVGTLSPFPELKAALVTKYPIWANLFIFFPVSHGCGWHCIGRCGCLSNREKQRVLFL